MNRRAFLSSGAYLLGVSQASAFGLGKLGKRFGSLGALGGAGNGVPSWVASLGPILPDIVNNWQINQSWTKTGGLTTPTALGIATTRATQRTNLLPTSPAGFAYTSFGVNTTVQDSIGRQTYESRTNFLLNSTAPATQTTGSLATGTYTLWVNGTGSATPSAGTATITGAAAATNGSPNTFVVTVAGTVTVTVSGSLNAFQLELNPGTVGAPTPLLVTGASTLVGAADVTTLSAVLGSSYTFFQSMTPSTPITFATNQELICASDGTSTNRAIIQRTGTSGNAQMRTSASGSLGSSSWAQAQFATVAASFTSGNAGAISFNNGTPQTSSSITAVSGLVKINFGSDLSATAFVNSTVAKDAIWLTQAIPNTQLQAAQ